MKNNQVILGVLGGLAAGALLGILFAPHKGSKTRKMIIKLNNMMCMMCKIYAECSIV